MLLTMKFGPFPIYVFAPIKTDPHETAISNCSPSLLPNNVLRSSKRLPTNPEAMAVNVRYVGALARKLDNVPDSQKNCHGYRKFSDAARASRISSAGIIVMKMPRNSAATSAIGWKWKWLDLCTPLGVVNQESSAIVIMMLSWMPLGHSKYPLNIAAAITPMRYRKFLEP